MSSRVCCEWWQEIKHRAAGCMGAFLAPVLGTKPCPRAKSVLVGQQGAPGVVIIPGVEVLTYSASRVLRKTPSFVGSHLKVQRLFLSHMLRLQARDGTEVSCPITLVKMFS